MGMGTSRAGHCFEHPHPDNKNHDTRMTDTAKQAMEDVLAAAVARMNGSAEDKTGAAMDPISLLAALGPKLLESREDQDDLRDKIDVLQTEDLADLREQMRVLNKRVARTFRHQEAMAEQLTEIREQQTLIGNAVLQLAEQLSRVELVDPGDFDDDDIDSDELDAADLSDEALDAEAFGPDRFTADNISKSRAAAARRHNARELTRKPRQKPRKR